MAKYRGVSISVIEREKNKGARAAHEVKSFDVFNCRREENVFSYLIKSNCVL